MPHPRHPSLSGFRRDTRGATVVEYGLILAVIALTIAGAMSALGHSLADMLSTITTNLSSAR